MGSALVAGYGSIGRRAVRNLRALGVSDITVYRTGRGTLADDEPAGVTVEWDLEGALARGPNAVFVANPTALHLPTALAAARAGCHLLVEKPVSHNLDGVEELRRIVADQQLVCLVGYQFRFHPGLLQVRRLLNESAVGQVVSVQAHWGEYLPDWHPWEDYRASYSARTELGGGVTLTLCHPLDYLRWLFGEVKSVGATLGYRGLDIEAEDTADIQLVFESGVLGSVHLDYLQRPHEHWLRIIGREGTIRWDAVDGTTRCFRTADGHWRAFDVPADFERDTMFLDETRHFLACIDGTETPLCTVDDGISALKIVQAAKRASAEGTVVCL